MAAPPRELITVISAKGGCGATFLAINLAGELAAHGETSILVLDLDFCKGDVAGFLDSPGECNLHQLVLAGDRVDTAMLRGCARDYAEGGFQILVQPDNLSDLDVVGQAETVPLLAAAREGWDQVIVDCGSRIDPATLAALIASDRILVVLTPDIPALRDARRILDLLSRLGVDPGIVRFVLNKISGTARLDEDEVEQQLGQTLHARIRRDEDTCAAADLEGRLVRHVAPLSLISRDIRRTWGALDEAPSPSRRISKRWSLPWSR